MSGRDQYKDKIITFEDLQPFMETAEPQGEHKEQQLLFPYLRYLYHFFVKAAEECGAKTWWLEAGTLLGWKRHEKSLIPWDYDVDVIAQNKDFNKLLTWVQRNVTDYEVAKTADNQASFFQGASLGRLLYEYKDREGCLKLYVALPTLTKDSKFGNPTLDIDNYIKHKGKKAFIPFSLGYRRLFPRTVYPLKTILPLQTSTFEGAACKLPADVEGTLSILYPDWKKPVKYEVSNVGKAIDRVEENEWIYNKEVLKRAEKANCAPCAEIPADFF